MRDCTGRQRPSLGKGWHRGIAIVAMVGALLLMPFVVSAASGPDLQLRDSELQVSGGASPGPVVGDILQVSGIIHNVGSVASGVTLELRVGDAVVQRQPILGTIASDTPFTLPWNTSGVAPGTVTLRVSALVTNDTSPLDNIAVVSLLLAPSAGNGGRLEVLDLVLSDGTPVAQQDVEVRFTVRNVGNASATTDVTLKDGTKVIQRWAGQTIGAGESRTYEATHAFVGGDRTVRVVMSSHPEATYARRIVVEAGQRTACALAVPTVVLPLGLLKLRTHRRSRGDIQAGPSGDGAPRDPE